MIHPVCSAARYATAVFSMRRRTGPTRPRVHVVREAVHADRAGGKEQRFCRPVCRRAYDAAGRRFVAEAIACGLLRPVRSGTALPQRARWFQGPSRPPRYPCVRNPPQSRQRSPPARPTTCLTSCSRYKARDGILSPQRCPRSYSTGSSTGRLQILTKSPADSAMMSPGDTR